MSFKNKRVLITGASSGIGEALALELKDQGAKLILAARRTERLDAIAARSPAVLVTACDVTSEEQLKKAATDGIAQFGGIDVVIANAGFGVAGPLDKLVLADYRRQFETNVFGVLGTIYATLEALKASQGTLVLIGSVASYVALPGNSPYSMSKSTITALAEAIRHELRPYGVHVVLISPGFIHSEIRKVDNSGVLHAETREPIPQWLLMKTDVAAKKIIRAIQRKKSEEIITFHGKVAVFVKRHFPWVIELMMKGGLSGRKEPKKNPQELGTPGGRLKNS